MLNFEKNKIMTNQQSVELWIDGNRREYVQEYVYLGQLYHS